MKKMKSALFIFGVWHGMGLAADHKGTNELVSASSMDWKRVGQRVAVGTLGALGAQAAVETVGAEKVLGVLFGLGAVWVPAYCREVRIGWNELFISGKRKEMLATGALAFPLVVGGRMVCELSSSSRTQLELLATLAAQGAVMSVLNNSVENRGTYLQELQEANKRVSGKE
jgi:hypothetical protein